MTTRERNLAVIIGIMAVLILGYYGLMSLLNAFDRRHEELTSIQEDIQRKERTIRRGQAAMKKRAELRQYSLPADLELARAHYRSWLIRSAESSGLKGVSIVPTNTSGAKNVFNRLKFAINAQATLDSAVRFLHEVSSAGHLHRIDNLTLDPPQQDGSKELRITMAIEALAMTDATDQKELTKLPGKRLAQSDLQFYLDQIVGRNPFGPANNPPTLADASLPKAHPKSPFKFTFKATDLDKQDTVSYQLDGDVIAGMEIDKKSGELRWTPEKLGEFEFAILAIDNGMPAKSVSKKFTLSVVDPPPVAVTPPAKPNYESAKHALVSAVVQVDDKPELWINVRTEGKVLKLREGEPIQVGEFKAVVKRIEVSGAEIEVNGAIQQLRLNDPLVPAEG